MDQKIFSKFNIYDQIGYLVPPFNFDTFLVWFIIAYFLGHLVQGISNLSAP